MWQAQAAMFLGVYPRRKGVSKLFKIVVLLGIVQLALHILGVAQRGGGIATRAPGDGDAMNRTVVNIDIFQPVGIV